MIISKQKFVCVIFIKKNNMAGIKPNEFNIAPLPLDGTEEVYSQKGGINEKYTVQDIWDGSPVSTGGTQTTSPLSWVLENGNQTFAHDIVTSDGDVIKARNGGGQLNLWDGADNVIGITNDNGNYGKAWFYGDDNYGQMGFATSSIGVQENNIFFELLGVSDSELVLDQATGYIYGNTVPSRQFPFKIVFTVSGDKTNFVGNAGLFLNTGQNTAISTIRQNVVRSVIIGGEGITAKINNTVYCNQISYQQSGNLYDTIITPSNVTADRLQTLQDADGIIALLSDIPTGQTLAETLTLGNITDGNDIIMSTGDVIQASQGGGQINLRALNIDDVVIISTDNGNLLQSFVGLTASESILGHTDKAQLILNSNTVLLHGYFPDAFTTITNAYIKVENYVSGSTIDSPFAIYDIGNKNVQQGNSDIDIYGLVLNSGMQSNPTIFLSGVTNSVAVGGVGLTIKTKDSIYGNQISLQESGNTFDNVIAPSSGTTQDNTATLPNTSGTIVVHNITGTSVNTNAIDGQVILGTGGVGGITIMLPVPISNQRISIKKVDAAVGYVTIDGNGADIEGLGTRDLINQWDYLVLVSDDTRWYIFGNN